MMQSRNSVIAMVCIAVVVLIALSAKVRTAYQDRYHTDNVTGDTVNKSESGVIDTEGKNAPEIIIDEEKIDEIPEPKDEPQKLDEIKEENNTPAQTQLPPSISLDIPFYAQAPDEDRELPWKEACEEASITLAAYYIQDKKLTKSQFKEDILAITKLEDQLFGSYIDTTVEQTAQVYNQYFGAGKTKIIDNPTIQQIKSELAQ